MIAGSHGRTKDLLLPPAVAKSAGMSRPASSKHARKKPTIYDLARLVDVSPGTVSRVLNNRDKVKDATRELVLRAAKKLNLKPQAAVRARQIAILSEPTFPDRIEGYAATMTAHLAFAFSKRGLGVLIPTNPQEELPGMFLDGVVAVTFDKALSSLLADLETRVPVVYTDKFDLEGREYGVCSDHFHSGYLAAKHFLAKGRRRLAFFGLDYRPLRERLAGFKKALEEEKAATDERLLTLFTPETSRLAVMTRMVKADADALYVPGTSFQAMECLHILTYSMGVKVPQDIALIGGENDGISSLLNPPLTTIAEPLREMAECAADMIDRLTAGEKIAERQVTLPVRLIERDSVG